MRLRRGDWIKEGKGQDAEIVGQVVNFKIEKNKTYKRMQTGSFDFYFSSENSAGIEEGYNDNVKEVIVNAVAYGVIQRRGAYFQFEDQSYQGSEKLINALKDDEALIARLKEATIEIALGGELD